VRGVAQSLVGYDETSSLKVIHMSRNAAFGLMVAAVLPTLALAQGAGPNTAPKKVEPGTYSVDPNHTQVGFSVSHMGFSLYSGRFSDASGELDLDPKSTSASRVRISVPVNTISTTSTRLDGKLKDGDWLDSKTFPTMSFTSTSVTPGAKGKAKVAGELTLHGITKLVTFEVEFIGSGVNPLDKKYTAGFLIRGDIKRSDFGVRKYVPLIGDAVHIAMNAAFEKN
jgi:polyisoprenoid-binding protein YceI